MNLSTVFRLSENLNLDKKTLGWVIPSLLFALFLSWGKNFSSLTNLMIDYFPFYDKFRAVSSIQVIIELLIPLIATIGVFKIFEAHIFINI